MSSAPQPGHTLGNGLHSRRLERRHDRPVRKEDDAVGVCGGNPMFCATVKAGSRLNAWKTNPTRSRRSSVRPVWLLPARLTPPSDTSPALGVSSPAATWRKVLFPEPDGPITAVNDPAAKPRV